MANRRRVRIFFLIVIELARKYTRSLIIGFFMGFLGSLLFWKLYPIVAAQWFAPVERIGVVGEFSPSTLPLSIQELISGGLTTLANDGTPQPNLASGWEATNSGKVFVFTLDGNKKWFSGEAVTSHDVNYNIRGVTFVPISNNTLVAYLQYPYSPFPSLVSKPIFQAGLNGFGEYQVKAIEIQGDTVKSLRLYPVGEGLPKFYTFYRTESQALLAFKMGEVNQLSDISTPSALIGWGKTDIVETTKYDRIVSLYFNMKNPLIAEKSVRQGLSYGVPDLPYERAISPISKTSWAYTDNVRKYSYDAKQAKKMILESPLASASGELTLTTFPTYLEIAQIIASSWTSLGVKTNVKVETSAPLDYEVLLSAQDLPPDPDQYPFWHSTQAQTNITGYTNVKIDKLLEDGRQELDQNKRKKIYADFARRITEDLPALFLFYPKTYSVQR